MQLVAIGCLGNSIVWRGCVFLIWWVKLSNAVFFKRFILLRPYLSKKYCSRVSWNLPISLAPRKGEGSLTREGWNSTKIPFEAINWRILSEIVHVLKGAKMLLPFVAPCVMHPRVSWSRWDRSHPEALTTSASPVVHEFGLMPCHGVLLRRKNVEKSWNEI